MTTIQIGLEHWLSFPRTHACRLHAAKLELFQGQISSFPSFKSFYPLEPILNVRTQFSVIGKSVAQLITIQK